MDFRVELDRYNGPLDLLLHLVRKQEIEIAEFPLAQLTQQYLDYVAVLEQLDVDSIGEFLDVASSLIELKSRVVLPQQEGEPEPELEDDQPKQDLVQRLLEFKKYRDAATELEDRGADWRRRFTRRAGQAPPRPTPREAPALERGELWDLVCAFGRVMQSRIEPPTMDDIAYDPTPVHVYVERVHARLVAEGEILFSGLFPERVHKSTLIATFLAVLELVRRRHAVAEQSARYADLLLRPGPDPLPADAAQRFQVVDDEAPGADG